MDHPQRLNERAVPELCDEGEHVVDLAGLDAGGRPVATQESVRCEEPKPRFVWLVELGEFADKPFKREKSVEPVRLGVDLASLPSRNGLRRRVQ